MKKDINKGVIINKLDELSYIHWIDIFVESVLEKSGISYEEAIIDSMEGGKRIFLSIDGTEYTIRTCDFLVTKVDQTNRPCAALINYTLYKQVETEKGMYGEEVFEGSEESEWNN